MKLISKKPWEKRNKKVFRRWNWLIHHVKLIYINTVFEEHVSSENIYILIFCCQWSTSSLIIEQIDVFQEVTLLGISKLNDSALDKKQGDLTQFFPKKDYRKRKMNLILAIVSHLTTVQTRKRKVLHTCKKLIKATAIKGTTK